MTLILVTALLLSQEPPAPRYIPIGDGLAVIVWWNADADQVVVFNPRNTDCPYPTIQQGFGLGTVVTQAPEGPPYDGRCVLRPGDRLYLQRYRDNLALGALGPVVVPHMAYLPMVQQ